MEVSTEQCTPTPASFEGLAEEDFAVTFSLINVFLTVFFYFTLVLKLPLR
ncbi:hypothetical protein UYSO10_4308 [Kosakonia radicincitans]|nr:hypothetical protein UYSO10_4308 [Kosakonia radicincitans]